MKNVLQHLDFVARIRSCEIIATRSSACDEFPRRPRLVGQVENLRAGWQPALSDAPSAVLVAAMLLSAAGNFACLARLRAFFSQLPWFVGQADSPMPLGFRARFMQNHRGATFRGRFAAKHACDSLKSGVRMLRMAVETGKQPSITTSRAVLHKSGAKTKWHWADSLRSRRLSGGALPQQFGNAQKNRKPD